MLYYLFDWLHKIGVPGMGVMDYISTRSALAVIFSLVITMWFGKKFIAKMRTKQIGESVRSLYLDGQNQKAGTPTMGGVIIIASIIVPVLLFCKLNNTYVLLLIFTTLWLGFLGFLDDYIKIFLKNKDGLSPKLKLFGQIICGIVIGVTLYFTDDFSASLNTTLPFLKNNEFDYHSIFSFLEDGKLSRGLSWGFFIALVIFIVVAVSNGANLTDGLDGLASGTSAVSGAALLVFAYVSGNVIFSEYLKIMYLPGTGEMVIFASAFIGATIGFMWYNSYPAQIFMGDTGSLMLGGVIAVMAILLRKELLIPIFCGIFLVENLSVIIQLNYTKYSFKKYGERRYFFLMAPLHHHYQKKGIHEAKIVARFIIINVILAVVAILALKIR